MDNTKCNTTIKRKESYVEEIWRRFKKNKVAVAGLIIILAMILIVIIAPLIISYDEGIKIDSKARLLPPSSEHWFGTDQFGRDVFSRIIYGGRISLSIAFIVTAITVVLGSIIGAFIALYGGAVDFIAMRICDLLDCVPGVLLTLTLVAALGTSTYSLFVAMTITSIPGASRYVRSLVLSVVGQEYIEAARSYGTKNFRLIIKYILPNVIGPIIINSTMSIGGVILIASGLSYIGMGVQPPTPEWGSMLSNAEKFIKGSPYLLYFPGFSIMLAALSLNLVGDGLRDALDPKMKN